MRLKNITLEGFQSYTEQETVTLDGLDLVAVIGPNGAGKTTLLNGIEFALFGKYRGDGINSVISRGAKQASVTVEFSLNDSTYRVRRVKTSTRHEVHVAVADDTAEDGWKVLEEKNPKFADPFLTDLLGMDYQTARTTWLIGQNDFGAFCELKPAPRREVLTNAFGLNQYADLADKADQHLSTSDRALAQARFKLDQVLARRSALENDVADTELHTLTDEDLAQEETRIEQEDEKVTSALSSDLGDVDSLQARYTSAQKSLQEVLDAHERDARRYTEDQRRTARAVEQAQSAAGKARDARDTASATAWDMDDLTEALASTQKHVTEIEQALPGMREAIIEHNSTISTHTTTMTAAVKQAQEINERIATLQRTAHGHEGECFACGQALSEDRARDMAAKLRTESSDLKKEHDASQAAVTQAQQDKQAAETAVRQAERDLRAAQQQAQKAQQEHREAERAAESIPQLEQALSDAQSVLTEAEAEQQKVAEVEPPVLDEDRVKTLRADVEKTKTQVQAAKEASGNRQQLRAQRDELRARQKRVWAEQQRRERVAKELADLDAPQAKLQAEHDDLAKDVETYRTLREAYRPAGIPAMILAGVVEELNDDANDVLADLGGQFGVNVTTQREKANGGVDEKVMIYVTTPEGEVDYASLSGSERFRCALALRIALARCIARRTGTPIETIIMDEGWGALDEEYRKAVQDVLAELSNDFSVYTVSHIDEIKASFPTVIEVTKDTGTSRAEVHGR